MPAADLPSLEHRLEACLIELDELQRKRPHLPDVLARAGAGQRIDELLDEIAELQQSIEDSPAETLPDAAVKLRVGCAVSLCDRTILAPLPPGFPAAPLFFSSRFSSLPKRRAPRGRRGSDGSVCM